MGDLSKKKQYKSLNKICEGVEYLHKNEIAHRDIKPENIMYNKETKEVKIIDFGSAKVLKKDKQTSTWVGTPLFVCPEIAKNNKYDI